jgi:hypothetical protein
MDYQIRRQKQWDRVPCESYSGLKVYRLADVPDGPVPEHGDMWGDWRLNTSFPPSLDYVGGHYRSHPYQIELGRVFRDGGLTWREGFMEWIEHLHGKTWGRASMGEFVDAVLTIGQYGYMKDETHISVRQEPKRKEN